MGCSTVERNNKHRIWIQQKIGHLDLKRNDESRYTKTDGNIGTAIWILSNKHSHLLHFLSYVLKHSSRRCQMFKQPKNGDLTRPKKDLTWFSILYPWVFLAIHMGHRIPWDLDPRFVVLRWICWMPSWMAWCWGLPSGQRKTCVLGRVVSPEDTSRAMNLEDHPVSCGCLRLIHIFWKKTAWTPVNWLIVDISKMNS